MALIELPEAVRRRALQAGAGAWLDALPRLIAALEREWSMSVGRLLEGGTEAFVAEAILSDESPAVLKLLIPWDNGSARNEITWLRLADGRGCARLLRSDVDRSAMLLERLGAPLGTRGLPEAETQAILCSTAQRLWRPAPDAGLPTGAEKGRWLNEFVLAEWERLGRPCSERAVEYGVACVARRIAAHDDERAVLVHGDIHVWNALEADGGYKLIDPDGLLAEAEYDLGVIMRLDPIAPGDPDPHARARWLATRTGLDEQATWEWSAIERLASGLTCLAIDLPIGRQLLGTADVVAQLG